MPTRSELRAIVRRDPLLNSTTVIADADLNTLLSEAALDLARIAAACPIKSSWSAVASAQTYVLSGASPKVTGFLDIFWEAGGLIYEQTSTLTVPLQDRMRSEAWLDLHIPGWQTADASDTLIYAYLTHDTSGYLALGVYPKSSTTTPTFRLYFLSRGTNMSDDTHYPWTGSTTNLTHTEPFQRLLAVYARWKCHEELTSRPDLAEKFQKEYLEGAVAFRAAQTRLFAAELHGLRLDAESTVDQAFGGLS